MKKALLLLAVCIGLTQCNKNSRDVRHAPGLLLVSEDIEIAGITDMGRQMGIVQLTRLNRTESKVEYQVTAYSVQTNDQYFNLNKSVYSCENVDAHTRRIRLIQGTESFTIDLNRGEKRLTYVEKGISLTDGTMQQLRSIEQLRFMAVIQLYGEILDSSLSRTVKKMHLSDNAPVNGDEFFSRCEYSVGYISHARDRTLAGINAFADRVVSKNAGCKKHFGVNIFCAFEDFGCYASQSIVCTFKTKSCPYFWTLKTYETSEEVDTAASVGGPIVRNDSLTLTLE